MKLSDQYLTNSEHRIIPSIDHYYFVVMLSSIVMRNSTYKILI